MARVLVTGGAGFLGSHLCGRLLAQGHHVTCLDDFSTGSADNLREFEALPAFTLARGDVTEPLTGQYQQIYHLACPASPVAYRRDPVRTWRVAALGTLRALELARDCGARFLLASTSEVYGDPLVHPQPEDYRGNVDTQSVRACYDEGKRAAETLAADFHRVQGTGVRIARIFNTYGPHMAPNDGRVVSSFIAAALAGVPLQLAGGGRQSRSFCYVDDLIGGLVALMECNAPDAHQPVNLGNPHEITIRELAETITRLTGSGSALVDAPAEPADPARRCPDIRRARALVGFAPATGIEQGLARTIAWARAQGASSR
ncbi:MAG: SDR family oxidoreductase [Planctomycetes bacterium]|jgi:UDP-glucuronate decarboxylase|nr:SDR family oxidoreductase [Planctomycetota bacterium]MCL4731039.1 SDR family oxidoreductase [Planctomycetota bacterium]